jgi:uncharacterized protein YggE
MKGMIREKIKFKNLKPIKAMKHFLQIFFLATSISSAVMSQTLPIENKIVVLGQAKLEVPANRVNFTVSNIATDSESLEKAYEKQAVLEQSLLKIFKDEKISKSNVKFSLVSVSKNQDYNSKQYKYTCSQTVNFTTDSVKQTTRIQELLINKGFTNFNSSFTLKDMDKYKKEILEKAVKVAIEKAHTMAAVAERKIKRIVKVMDTEGTDPTLVNYGGGRGMVYESSLSMNKAAYSDGLIDIPQTISLSETIKVVFELE